MLTGVNGQVGHALSPLLDEYELVGLARENLDLSNSDAIREAVRDIRPDIIINPAAYTAVDKAESEPDIAHAINGVAPGILAEEAARVGSALIHFSTDYVYDGTKQTPYNESDSVNPTSIYGKTKLAGENAIRAVGLPHLILRTSWVYGDYGKNFLKTIIRLASEREQLGIVADQIGAPTASLSIATALKSLLEKWTPNNENQTGVYHFTNTGSTSWHGFACEIVKQYNEMNKQPELKVELDAIKPLTTADYPTPADRPANSCLSHQHLAHDFDGLMLPSWQDGLKAVMQRL